MTEQNNKPEQKDLKGAISNAIKARAMALLATPPDAKKTPSNAGLWVVWAAFTTGLLFTEFVSAVSVYLMIMGVRGFLYAVATFFSGFLFFEVHSLAYTRAYASKFQTGVAILGMLTTAGSTITIGIATAVVNGLAAFKVIDLLSGTVVILEVGIMVVLTAGIGWQVLLLATYFFTDPGLIALRKYGAGLATNETLRKNLSLAQDQAEDLLKTTDAIDKMAAENKEDIVDAIYGGMTGRSIKVSGNGNGNGDHPSTAG